ncbi:MAG: TolC family protein [Planctomycetes bacterium]|jgi:cobalt-zinc-cadmium efflux system outer membrane protein|nr:TolC family protein [Planctomycetota bacterium]
MKTHFTYWFLYTAACVSGGCTVIDHRIRSSDSMVSAASTTSFGLKEDKPGEVTQAAYIQASDQPSSVVQPASIDVVVVDPVRSTDGLADGATLEELLTVAFANNPAIKELAATTQIAAGYRTQVGLYANPMVGYQGQQLADAGTDQHLLFVQQQIITGNKLELNRAVLNEAVRAQLQELEAQKLRVATDIKTAYYDSVRIQKQIGAIDQFSGLLKQGVDAAEKRMKAGEGSKIDLLQTQVQLKQLELDRRQLSASLSARLREIVALSGVPNMQIQSVAGELPEPPTTQDWNKIEDELVSKSPEYAAAQARIRQARAAVRRQESQPLPNLGVQFGAGVDNGTNSGMMNVQISAPIPIFNKNQGNIAAAKAEYCRALQEAQRIDNAIRARLAVASGDYSRAAEAVNMYLNELLPAAQQTLDLAEAAYRGGEQDFIQLLVTRRTYFDTNLAYIAAKAQLATAQAQIDGYLLTGALNAVINSSGDDSLRGETLDQE